MNELKDLVNKLDGFSCDNTGFKVLRANKNQDYWDLIVQGYHKDLDFFSAKSSTSVFTLVDRIEDEYSNKPEKWKVLKVEELEDNIYNLTVKYQGDNKNEENNNSQEKQMATEK